MILKLERKWKKPTYSIGRLYIDGVYFCNTLEDRDRMLKKDYSLSFIMANKVYGETAIPTGTYRVDMNEVSHKYETVAWYNKLCGGKMPRLKEVPGFDGILIHPGNTALDTLGCILVGKNTKVGQLTESRATFEALYKKMRSASDRGESIFIEIVA